MKQWNSVDFTENNWNSHPIPELRESVYDVPVVSEESPNGFYRIFLENSGGMPFGPLPLKVGKGIFGNFGKSKHYTGLDSDGNVSYDFILDTLGFTVPIEIFVRMSAPGSYKVTVFDLTADKAEVVLAVEYPSHFSVTEFLPLADKRYLARIELLEEVNFLPFHIYADFKPESHLHSPGESIRGNLSHDDLPYIRHGYYSDRYRFQLVPEQMYKVTVSAETLDPVIISKNYFEQLFIEEIDEHPPGKTEEYLFYSEWDSTPEFMVGSWRFEETGDYTLQVEEYNEPLVVRPNDDFLAMTDATDRISVQGKTLFRLDSYEIKDFDVSQGITITLNGVENHRVAFAIIDLIEKETVHQSKTTSGLISFFFNPEVDHEYELIIISREENLGKNFKIKAYNGNIFDPGDSEEGPETVLVNRLERYQPSYFHEF